MITWRAHVNNLPSGLNAYPIGIRNAPSTTTTKWDVGVRQYPVFAEYSEGKAANGSTGLSDTGFTMRALLPVNGQDKRSSIHVYKGFSRVFDTRVVCVRPNITNLEVGEYPWNTTTPVLRGTMSIPLDLVDIAAAVHLYGDPWSEFSCQVSNAASPTYTNLMYHSSDWKLSICQVVNRGGGNLTPAWLQGKDHEERTFDFLQKSYLLMNFTGMISSDAAVGDKDPNVLDSNFGWIYNDSRPGLVRKNNADWVDIYRMTGDYTTQELATRLSFSLCFSAFRARSLNISASSSVPLVEPRYQYDPEIERLNFSDVRKQLLTSSGSIQDRGILSLASQNWSATWGDDPEGRPQPYFHYLDVDSLLQMETFDDARTIHLVERTDSAAARADVSIGGLVLDILRSNGTTAEAVQSMLMVALGSRYQDYFFYKDDGIARKGQSNFKAQRADFIAVEIPIAIGATLSYLLIMIVIIIHSTVVCSIITWYLKGMSFLSSFDQRLK
jgi:hypothetical protein